MSGRRRHAGLREAPGHESWAGMARLNHAEAGTQADCGDDESDASTDDRVGAIQDYL